MSSTTVWRLVVEVEIVRLMILGVAPAIVFCNQREERRVVGFLFTPQAQKLREREGSEPPLSAVLLRLHHFQHLQLLRSLPGGEKSTFHMKARESTFHMMVKVLVKVEQISPLFGPSDKSLTGQQGQHQHLGVYCAAHPDLSYDAFCSIFSCSDSNLKYIRRYI